jgi:hypothetical protein
VEGRRRRGCWGAPDRAKLAGAWTVGGGSGGFTEDVLGGATVSIEADVAVAVAGAGGALYLSVAKLARPGELGGGREPVCAWGERARE